MKTYDLTYITKGLWTSFYANTEQGVVAVAELGQLNGDNKVLTMHLNKCLKALRVAGYSVNKVKKATKKDIENIYKELKEMGV